MGPARVDSPVNSGTPILKAEKLTVRFGGLDALCDLDLLVQPGAVTGLIGPNGAGKTTFFNVVSGLVRPTAGHLVFGEDQLLRLPPWERARRGIARTFQTPKLMPSRTALENVEVGNFARSRTSALADLARWPSHNRPRRESEERAREVLRRVDPGVPPEAVVAKLSLAQRRTVEIARALCCGPRLLLLDEPFGGLHVEERERMLDTIRSRWEEDRLSILLIEHDMGMVGRLCSVVYVLNFGRLLAVGTPDEISHDPAVVQAYLGEEAVVA